MYQYSYAYPWPKPQTKTLRTFSLMACDGPTLSEVWENCKIKKMKNNSAFMGLSLFWRPWVEDQLSAQKNSDNKVMKVLLAVFAFGLPHLQH